MIHHLSTASARRCPRLVPAAILIVSALAFPALAAAEQTDAEILRQMERMQQQMQKMAREIESLRAELATTQARLEERESRVAAADEAAGRAGAEEGGPEVSIDRGHLEVASDDGDFEVEIGGRLQIDAAAFDEDEGSIGNGTELRRARLYVAGKFDRHWGYKSQVDFAGNDVSVKDAYLRYGGLPVRLTIGNFKEPFSLEEQTSSRFITFMERGLPNVFAPGRNLGIGADVKGGFAGRDGGWGASLGIFGEGIDDPGFDSDAQREDDEGIGVTGRLTVAPIATEQRLMHFGGSASYRDTGDDTAIRLRQRFESHIADRRLVDTGRIDAVGSLFRAGTEAAFALGPFSLQGEYLRADLQRSVGPDVDFSGYYLYGSWFLTGESRASAYSTSSGKFGRLQPHRPVGAGIGAWELAARFSRLDLTDRDIAGGEEENLTLGLNWYPLSNLRFSANYVHVLDVSGGPRNGDEPAAFQMRAQVDF